MLVGGYILPCGALALCAEHKDPGYSDRELAETIQKFSRNVGSEIISLKPDVTILLSPHELADPGDIFAIFLNEWGMSKTRYMTGCDCHGCTGENRVGLDKDFAEKLVQDLSKLDENVVGLEFRQNKTTARFGDYATLRWSSGIPISAMNPPETHKFVVVSTPNFLAYKATSFEACRKFGRSLLQCIEDSEKRIAVVACGDLHHGHATEGPYGKLDIAEHFDSLCEKWAAGLDFGALTEASKMWPGKARSCGFPGFVILNEILMNSKHQWKPNLHVVGHPSYFGMMVVSFDQ